MINEFILLAYIIVIAASCSLALQLGSHALIALMSLFGVLANLFVTKEIELFSFAASSSDALAVGVTLCLNLLQEFYGKAFGHKAIWTSFFCVSAYTLFSKLHLWYIPHTDDTMHEHFHYILSSMPRIIAASLFTYFVVQNFDLYFYALTKKIFPRISFALRNILCISISHFIDTILFSLLGLYGIIKNIGQIMVVSYSIKLITIFFLVPLTRLCLAFFNIKPGK